jgi:hypothetical protein
MEDWDFDGETLVVYVGSNFTIDLLPGILAEILQEMLLPTAESISHIEIIRG